MPDSIPETPDKVTEPRRGVWTTFSLDYGVVGVEVWPDEISALRHVVKQGYGSAEFTPWGVEVGKGETIDTGEVVA